MMVTGSEHSPYPDQAVSQPEIGRLQVVEQAQSELPEDTGFMAVTTRVIPLQNDSYEE
jgi:hypothetical protein